MVRCSTSTIISVSLALSIVFAAACGPMPATRSGSAPPARPAAVSTEAGSSAQPYSLADVEEMVRGGMRTARILEIVRQDCIGFRVTGEVITRLTAAGADDPLISGLRTTCQRP